MKLPMLALAGTLGVIMLGGLTPLRAWGAAEESFVLPNGLKVILVSQPGNPVVSMRVMVKTGAADESNRAEYGLAHLMEHMAFKGTARHRDPGLISALVERNGGDMNAYTSSDATVYYINLPADQVVLGLDILSELVFHPIYDPHEYELEKEVVIEEIKRGRDNPDRILMEIFFDAAYPDHPYGRPVIGYEETVRAATVEVAKAFHTFHYRPDNAVLVVTGGFDRAAVQKAIDEFFASIPKPTTPLRQVLEPALAPPSGPVVRVIESDQVAQAKVFIGFRGPAGKDQQAPVQDLLASVLSGGKASRLIEIIKDEKQLVTDISAASYTPRYQGNFFISFETSPDKVLAATEAVWKELERISAEIPDEDELSRARALAEKGFLAGQESALGLASQITEFETMFGDWRLRDAYLPLWNRTDPSELSQSAADHFRSKNLTIAVMLPPTQKGDGRPSEADLNKLASRLSPTPASEEAVVAPAFQEMRLKAGPRLLVMRDSTLPLVNVRMAAFGGLLADSPEQEGLNNFMTSVWGKATKGKSAVELSRAIENIGASLGAFSGRNSVGMGASFLASNLDEAFPLFVELLTSPAFAESDVEKIRPEILAQIKAQDEQLGGRVFRLLTRKLYPDNHPYSLNPLGNAETVEKIKVEDLKNLYQKLISPENIVISVAGDVEPLKVRDTFEALLADWKPSPQARQFDLPNAPPAIDEPVKVKEVLDRAQTHIAFGFQAPGLGEDEGPALDVLASYLGGMSGPLFRELRDQQSLAYTVQCAYNPGLNIGSFSFYIATDPRKVDEALNGFNDIIERIRTKTISDQDLEGAKRYLVGSTKIRLQTVASRNAQVVLNSLYNLGLDYEEQRLKAIEKVTAEEVRQVAAKYLDKQHGVLAVLGQGTPGPQGAVETAPAKK